MTYALTPRPELALDELAALVAVAEELINRPTRTIAVVDHASSWRFSGRWFNSGPFADRRPQRFS